MRVGDQHSNRGIAALDGRETGRSAQHSAAAARGYWTKGQYGAGAECLAERLLAELARRAAAALVVDASGAGLRVTLSQISPDKYPKRVDAIVTLPDGRDLGRALTAAGVTLPWTGKRVDWCG